MNFDEGTKLLAPALTPNQMLAAKTYKANNYHGVSDQAAMAEAMRVIIHKLFLAREAYLARDLEQMCAVNAKNLKILEVLREEIAGSGALEDAEAAEPAKFLHKLYSEAFMRLTDVLITPKPEEEFTALAELFKPVYKAWLPAAPDKKTAETKANAV